jgi:hypothetical protein
MLGDNLADCHPVGHHGHDRRNRHPQATDGRLAAHDIWVGRDPAEDHASMVLTGAVGRRPASFLAERCYHRVVAVASALQESGDRQRGDGLVAVEEPRPVGDFPLPADPLGGRCYHPAVDLQVHEPSPILIA